MRRASQAKGLKPGCARQLSSLKFPTPEKWALSGPPRKGVVSQIPCTEPAVEETLEMLCDPSDFPCCL